MTSRSMVRVLLMAVLVIGSTCGAFAQKAQKTAKPADDKAELQAYIDLIRTDLKQQKTEVLSTNMGFTPDQAAAFWPIYKSYDAELTKLGDRRLAIIKDYGEHFDSLTAEKANELTQKSFAVMSERDALLRKCYEQVKQKLGATKAARFAQLEHLMLQIVDLQVTAQLPLVK